MKRLALVGMSMLTVILFALSPMDAIARNQPRPCATTECSANHVAKQSYQELAALFVIAFGRVKNPVYDNYLFFQVIDLRIIGLFTIDLGVVKFQYHHLNEAWFGFHMHYFGINFRRIILFHPETTFLCGVVTTGYFDTSYSSKS